MRPALHDAAILITQTVSHAETPYSAARPRVAARPQGLGGGAAAGAAALRLSRRKASILASS